MGNYDFHYNPAGPYGAVVRLLSDAELGGRVVLDLGCGVGAVAEPLRERGAEYVGVDVDGESVAKLAARGFEAHVVDLARPDLRDALEEVLAGRPLAAVLGLDFLEHVVEPKAVVDVLAELSAAHQDVELVVSVPNVAHADLARQLLAGRWEMTDSGLLDRTHLRFFTERTLTRMMTTAGWYEAAREDFRLERSDQNVAGHPLFEPKANAGRFLSRMRSGADDFGTVNQFVRRYHRGVPRRTEEPAAAHPFLSVVVRTRGVRTHTLVDVLCCLGAQTDLDFEVLLVVHDSTKAEDVRRLVDTFEGNVTHRVRVVPCDGGTRSRPANVGLRAATGEYVVFLDDDDLVTADWVENIKAGATAAPGTVVRWWAAEQTRAWAGEHAVATHAATGPLTPQYTTAFDLVRHLRQNETPFHCFAVPRVLVELGLGFDETLTVCEDWAFLLQAASICGVHDTNSVTAIYSKWTEMSSSHEVVADEWLAMRSVVHVKLDAHPLLLPPGSVRVLDLLQERLEFAEQRVAALEAELAATREASGNAHRALNELRASTSWKVSAPVRMAGAAARKLRKRY
ncbi:methyltransferase domain-containing protein [Actinosynnema sp. CA-248983]